MKILSNLRHYSSPDSLRRWLHALTLAALLAGLIPPPLLRTVLPVPAAELAEAILPEAAVAQAAGNVTGTVFHDYDGDGIDDGAGEIGLQGVTVTAYNAAGASVATATSAANGSYTLNLNAVANSTPLRIEFTNWPSGYQPGPVGANNASSVRFVTAAAAAQSNIDFGLNDPSEYSQANPLMVSPTHLNGLAAGNTAEGLVSFAYNASGVCAAGNVCPTGLHSKVADIAEIGTTWGVAWQPTRQQIYLAAMMKRHADFADSPAEVYVFTKNGGTINAAFTKFSLQGITPANGGPAIDLGSVCRRSATDGDPNGNCLPSGGVASDYTLGTPTAPNIDFDAFDKVGKASYGDADLSEDDKTLWLVNLRQLALLAVDVSGATIPGAVNQYSLSTMGLVNDTYCTPGSGQLRPWALHFYRGKGYLGAVCTAETSLNRNDLKAYVFSFNPANPTVGVTTALSFPLTFIKQGNPANRGWEAWISNWSQYQNGTGVSPTPYQTNSLLYTQPILADIEFDDNGSMILSFVDRFGHQVGQVNRPAILGSTATTSWFASGDIVHACNVNGALVLEGTAASCPVLPNQNNDVVSPGVSGNGEYYNDQRSDGNGDGGAGGLALLHGSGEVVQVFIDPQPPAREFLPRYQNAQGIEWFPTAGGIQTDALWINGNGFSAQLPVFNKTNGMGDVELLSDAPPIEIGNRVWNDLNGNGIQDAGENPLQNIIVELYKSGVKVGQATTNSQGEYYFTSGTNATDSNPNDNVIHDGGIGIRYDTGTVGGNSFYEIRIPNISGGSKQAALGVNILTMANAGSVDLRDSDGVVNGSNANYPIPYADLAGAGYNNHTYDFGFTATGTIQIVKNTVGSNGAFDFTSADVQLDAVNITTVSNTGNSGTPFVMTAGTYAISEDAPPANWALLSLACTGDSDSGSVVTLASRQVVIDLDVGENIVCTFTNAYTPPTGTIQIVKQTVASNGIFTFSSADPQLDAVSITTVGNTGNSGAVFTKNVGSYTISEDTPAANWALTGLSCTGDTDSGSTVTLASRQVAIDLDVNENIICTFTNTYTPPKGAIQVTKQVVTTNGSNPVLVGNFTINISCPGSTPTPSNSQSVAAGAAVTFGNLTGGNSCTISENTLTLPAAPAGYVWVSHTVNPSLVTVTAGVTSPVTVTNTLAPILYTLRKQLNTPDPVRVGATISFTIRITNTGSTAITVLPLRDLYDTNNLLYLSADVLPDDSTNDGQLDWSDLTASFGQDLAPNASFAVTTAFIARRDTSLLPGGATTNSALVLITPTQSVTVPVRIQSPTLIDVVNRRATYADGQVTLVWETASEANAVAFNVLRQVVDPAAVAASNGEWVKLNAQPLAAQQPGQAAGASYSYNDTTIIPRQSYRYVVEILDTSGLAAYRDLGTITVGSILYLPVVAR